MPEASRTYPEIAPDRSPAHAGSATATITAQYPKWRSFTPTPAVSSKPLFHGERRRRINRLLGDVVVHFDVDLVHARRQIRRSDGLLQRHLLAYVTHLLGGFGLLDHRFVGCDVDDVELERGRWLVRLIVHAQIIDLHPEVYLLIFTTLEEGRLAVRRSYSRSNFGEANHEIAGAYVLGGHGLHLICHDEGGGRQLIVGELRHHDAATPQALAITVHIFHRDLNFVTSRTQRQRLPVHRGILCRTGQEFRRHIHLSSVFEGLHNLSGQRGYPAKDIDGATLHAIFVGKCDIAILHLDRDRNQHRVAGNFHKI